MSVNFVQWRVVIGIFNCRSPSIPRHVCNLTKNRVFMFKAVLLCWHYFESAFIFFVNAGVYVLLLYNVLKTLNQIQDQGN